MMMMSKEYVLLGEKQPLIKKLKRREEVANFIEFASIAMTAGSLIALTQKPNNAAAYFTFDLGLQILIFAAAWAMLYNHTQKTLNYSEHDVKLDSRERIPNETSSKLEKQLNAMRRSFIFGAIAASSIVLQLQYHPSVHGTTLDMIFIVGSLTAMLYFGYEAYTGHKDLLTNPQDKRVVGATEVMFMGGALTAGAGALLRHENALGFIGADLLLIGAGLMLAGLILHRFQSETHSIKNSRENYSSTPNTLNDTGTVKSRLMYGKILGALVAAGSGMEIMRESLLSPSYNPSLTSANMITFMVGISVVLLTMGVTSMIDAMEPCQASNDTTNSADSSLELNPLNGSRPGASATG